MTVFALIPRTAALVILLYQIRFFAADLADTPFFIASLAGAFLTAIFLHKQKIRGLPLRPVLALLTLALVPWVIRLFIALPRLFFPGVSEFTIILDSLLLNLDRNNFSALFPFYWMAFTTYLSLKSRTFLRADIIAADTLFLVLFSIAPSSSLGVYRWPVFITALFSTVIFLQILSLVLSTAPELRLRRKEAIFAGVFLFFLVFTGGSIFIRPFQKKALEKGGGLLEPKLFRFDFSQILRLESEISMNDDLVLIVKFGHGDYHDLIRRYTLSGYSSVQGFFRFDEIDEAAHPRNLPLRRTALKAEETKNFREMEQEYYLVNFDSSAFIGVNMPVEITPFETWDASSFNSAYSVRSHTSEVMTYELAAAVRGLHGPENLGLTAEEYAFYTEYGADETVASLAQEIIRGPTGGRRTALSYWEQVRVLYDWLKYGEYRYSLKPGIAPDGDQLKHFLFTSKKGYCSYYAFAFTLMLRSLGIPSRVAAGFFVVPTTEAFDYYPVRSDMAHTWVEVWFPGYGWIEFDPTSQMMAEGEDFRFSDGTPPELFERLLKEILENRSRLTAKEGPDAESEKWSLLAIGREAARFLARRVFHFCIPALILIFLALRCGFLCLSILSKDPRKKALRLWYHIKRRLALAGLRKAASDGEAEWAKAADRRIAGIYTLYLDAAAARFAPVNSYTAADSRNMAEHYRSFRGSYQKAIPLSRRIMAWILPPITLIAGPRNLTWNTGIILALLFIFLLCEDSSAQDTSRTSGMSPQADELYQSALASQEAENWERAIELFNTGAKSFTGDFRFPWSLGNLYHHRQLYRLAWDEYRRTEKIFFTETFDEIFDRAQAVELLLKLANTAGCLNMNEVSAEYLERLLAIDNGNTEAIGSLAWMYFKLHRFDEGEKLLLDASAALGQSMDFSMTLGTIYTGMFRYHEAKEAYEAAIREAENSGDRYFAALAYYNLSILESRFYKFALSYDCASASLEAMNRSSGRLARGELYQRRMEMNRALGDYQEAYSMDSSPLSKLNLAIAYQIGGLLNEAVLYAKDCLKANDGSGESDQSWMINYGIDPIRYKRDIHEILKDAYKGLYKTEKSYAKTLSAFAIKDSVRSFFLKVSHRFRWELHTQLFRKYSLLSAQAYGISRREAIQPEALLRYFDAFEAYPERALAYLAKARGFEEQLIPASAPSYAYNKGRLLSNRKLISQTLNRAIGEFDPLWERDMIAKAYAELALKGGKAGRQDAAERLFAINRGALLQNGIKLPVEIQIARPLIHMKSVLEKTARTAGLETFGPVSPRYTLRFDSEEDGYISCELYDGGRGITVWKQNLPYPAIDHRTLSRQKTAIAKTLRDGIFDAF